MITLSKIHKFILAVGIQIVILLSIVIFNLILYADGTTLLLRISPVDPTSPLRGDYVTFEYENISRISKYLSRGDQIRNGNTVYVSLTDLEKISRATSISRIKPKEGSVFLRGKVISGGLSDAENYNSERRNSDTYHVVYGIEEYFIPEGSGRRTNFRGIDMTAMIAVDDDGTTVLKNIYMNGNKWPSSK